MHWKYPEEWMEKWKVDLILTQKDFSEQSTFKIKNESGVIMGFCSIKEHRNGYEIVHLWIKPAYIGKSYGKHLLNEAIKQVVVLKEKPIVVEAEPNAEYFIQTRGSKRLVKRKAIPVAGFYL